MAASSFSAQQATAKSLQGTMVLWGGVIIAADNLKDETQLEILAYPLDREQKPDTGKTPLGRFIVLHAGYLETTDYAQGRLLSVSGTLRGSRHGRIGESEYDYPLLNAQQLQLWPRNAGDADTRFHFGIGVIFHN